MNQLEDEYLEDYDIQEYLGNGAFSTVYRAIYQGREVAVKVLDKKMQSQVDWFRKEIAILEQLDHPNIVRYITSRESQKKLYIVLEYINGVTLTDYMKQGKMVDGDIRHIMRQILEVVSHLHNLDITHRDIKPDNIMVLQNMQIKLIDFGLSLQSECKLSYDKCGTLLYMAPEMILKQPYLKSVDMWSCGIIQYMMYNNRHPHWEHSEAITAFVERIHRNEVNFHLMDKYAINFYQKCASISPEARMSADMALSHPWITGHGELGPITMADMIGIFATKMSMIKIIKSLMAMKFIMKQSEVVQTFKIPLPSDFSVDDVNNDTTSESKYPGHDFANEYKLFRVNRTSSRANSQIKQARSTSQLFFENNTYVPFKPQSPFKISHNKLSPHKTMTHSQSLQFAQLSKKSSVGQRLPPLCNSNSPVHQKKQAKRTNIQFKMMK